MRAKQTFCSSSPIHLLHSVGVTTLMAKIFNSLLLKNFLTQTIGKSSHKRTIHCSTLNMIKVGENIPSVVLYEKNPTNAINMAEFCKGKKVVLFGVPGAFTPGCSKTHLPGYIERYVELKKKGVDEIVCVSVNDTFVMDAWGKDQDATGKIRMFSDPDANFTKVLGLDIELPALGGTRSKRYVMVIDNGVITVLQVEPDGTGLSCSLAPRLNL